MSKVKRCARTIENAKGTQMKNRLLACFIIIFGWIATAMPAQASSVACPGIDKLPSPRAWSDRACTVPILDGGSYRSNSSYYPFWIGGGNLASSWLEVDVSCDGGIYSNWAERGCYECASEMSLALDDYKIHQCTATFDTKYYPSGSPHAPPIKWTIQRIDKNGVKMSCEEDFRAPLSFSCLVTNAGEPVANRQLYFDVSVLVDGKTLNALDAVLDLNFELNGSKTSAGAITGTSGIWGVTDASGYSKIRMYLDFKKMSDHLKQTSFPSLTTPLTLHIDASSSVYQEAATSVDVKVTYIGTIDQVWVTEAPGCQNRLVPCSRATMSSSDIRDELQRSMPLSDYRKMGDTVARLLLQRSGEADQDIDTARVVRSGDTLHFDARNMARTHCPACQNALRADGTLEPSWVVAKLSFLDGAMGMVGINSDQSGTYDVVLGKLASVDFASPGRKFYYLNGAKAGVIKATMFGIGRWFSPVAYANSVLTGIEVIGAAASASRTYFVNLKSTVFGQTDYPGASKLTTLEGEGTLILEGPDTIVGTVPAGYTAQLKTGQDIPEVRPSTAEETRLASEKWSLLNNFCSIEEELYNNGNTGACGYNKVARFSLNQPTMISRIKVWYDTRIGGSRLEYTLNGPGKDMSGVFASRSCDPYQTQWCQGEARINQVFAAGTYTITTGTAAVCQNSASQGNGFAVVNGCSAALKSTAAANYQGLWWSAPAASESGWGINFAHQGDVIFVTWFTYDLSGKAWWLTMTATKTAEGVYSGTIFQTHGPAFSANPFNPAAVTATQVGTGTLTFTDANTGSFAYTVNGVGQVKPITRQVFGPLPTCVFGAQANLAVATNFQDIWYAAPAESEAGWGVNFAHQGDTIFATWFTYNVDGTPLWLSATATKSGPGVYTGKLYRTTGPAFNAVPFLPAKVGLTEVGTLTITFANGNSANFAYTVALSGPASAVTQTKAIVRQVFRAPGTVCQ
jgi:hypothetical protein